MIPKRLLPTILIAAAALAGPSLTTIQDTLYKADGTRFNGTLTITWNSFQAADSSAIVTQSTSVKVLDGVLRVQLVPVTTATPQTYYQVTYNSDGRIQFTETWSVPFSATPLRVRDVRTVGVISGQQTSTDTTGPIQESDIVGLVADLNARPIRGEAYAPGRVAVVNASGAIESATGSFSDCVHVDGTSGPCGAQTPSFVDRDTLLGLVDGSNPVYSISSLPDPPSSLAVYRNGLLQTVDTDYTASGQMITFLPEAVPQPGDILAASYRLSGGDSQGSTGSSSAALVLCGGTGGETNATSMGSVGTCFIPPYTLNAGDRVEVRFDLEHAGTNAGFTFELRWGSTTIVQRDAAAGDVLATVHADGSILSSGVQFSAQSWGTVLPLSSSVLAGAESHISGLAIDFRGKVGHSADKLLLRNYSVVRLR